MAKMNERPRTIREYQSQKKEQTKQPDVRVVNVSKQLVKIHLRPPKNIDFYHGAQDVPLTPGQSFNFKKDRLWMEQLERLQKSGFIQVIGG